MRLPVVQRQRAAVRCCDGVRDRKTKAEPRRFIHVAGLVAAHERLQHILLQRIRNAGAVVFDVDGELIRRDAKADHRFGAKFHGILHQVGDGAVQIVGPHGRHGTRGAAVAQQPSFPKGKDGCLISGDGTGWRLSRWFRTDVWRVRWQATSWPSRIL
jgi:hypothetical protein